MSQAFSKRPEKASYTASRTFARRCKHLMKNDFFIVEFLKALKAEGISLEVGSEGLQFISPEPVPKPTHKELMKFWEDNHKDVEQ